ncbi:alpha/beta hydrolase [Segnochrobactrum spirostomi]|nr:alpha/beta hydrolase [Segnochrobactrum spirostomi]
MAGDSRVCAEARLGRGLMSALFAVAIVATSPAVAQSPPQPALAQSSTQSPAPPPADAPADGLEVGSLVLTPCVGSAGDAYCGTLPRPLDPSGTRPGTIKVGFEFYPAAVDDPAGTIVAQEGGPGFSTTGTRTGFLHLFGTLRDRHNILLVDKRGTGLSQPIDCPDLQKDPDLAPEAVGACGAALGDHAWDYGTALAADDLAAVIEALEVGPVAYYGDSYGTYFGAVFAARHPTLLRTLVLDSAYPPFGPDPWYATEWAAGRDGFDLVCARSPSCTALGGRSTRRLADLLDAVRKTPLSGTAPDGDGTMHDVTLDAPTLFMVMNAAGSDPVVYRELDAAARAWLVHQDGAPLLRLTAEARDMSSPGGVPVDFSSGLYAAIVCTDYRQLFDLRLSPAERRAALERAVADKQARHPDIYAPFTIDEVRNSPRNVERLDLCLDWPAPPDGRTPGAPLPAATTFPSVPTLVLAGDLDNTTAPDEGFAAARLFPDPYFVLLRNTSHVAAMTTEAVLVPPVGSDAAGCAGPMTAAFVGDGGRPPSVRCAAEIRPIRTVPAFARTVAEVAPASPAPASLDAPREADLRLAAAAAETAGDVLARYFVNSTEKGVGLRGGHFSLGPDGEGYRFTLDGVRWTQDLAVSGTIDWNQVTGEIDADLDVAQDGGPEGHLTLHWNDRRTNAQMTIDGQLDDRDIDAVRLAP